MSKNKDVSSFLRSIEAKNLTVADWARREDLPLTICYAVINGRLFGKRGQARRVMAAMGLPLPSMHSNKNVFKPQE